jgi:8-oxo-dGTP pyrophosphatase MutT (NUDIX family)
VCFCLHPSIHHQVRTCTYTDQEGKQRQWDYATRTTKQSKDSADAVIIIPILQKDERQDGDEGTIMDTILVSQYRPPTGRETFEFPAGLIDKGETPEQAALRELKEETGYTGNTAISAPSQLKASRLVCMSPGLCDETVKVVM